MDSSEKMKYSLKRRFIRWMEDNRGLILTVIGLPASFIFDLVMQVSCINKVVGMYYIYRTRVITTRTLLKFELSAPFLLISPLFGQFS